MIDFINLQDVFFRCNPPRGLASRANRHMGCPSPSFAGAEPRGESRCVGKTAPFSNVWNAHWSVLACAGFGALTLFVVVLMVVVMGVL